MDFIKKIWTFFQGKKTYIAAILMAGAGLITGDKVLVFEALALAGLRNAIK